MKSKEVNPIDIARFVEQDVYDDVTEFHARSNYTNIPGITTRCYLSSANDTVLNKLAEAETPLWAGFKKTYGLCTKRSKIAEEILRNESAEKFCDDKPILFSDVEQLITDAFTARSNISNKRPYPSGGALYPIETFLCRLSNQIDGWPLDESVLHVLPLSRAVESIASPSTNHLLKVLSGNNQTDLGAPHFAIVYAIFFEKAIFKYRRRGYRLALLEAGSMYQWADICAKNLGFRSRMWAGFTDHQVSKKIGINCKHIAPLAIQFFGKVE